MTPTDFSIFKNVPATTPIFETTQLNNDQMPKLHCHCECSKCQTPAPSHNTSLQSPYLRNLLQPCRSVPVAGCLR